MPNTTTARRDRKTWTPSLTQGLIERRSSMIKRPAARPDTTSSPGVSAYPGRKISTAAANPANSASPPSRGVGLACAWRPPGWAISPVRRDTTIASGTTSAQTANATSSGHSPGSRWSRRLVSAPPPKKSVKRIWDRELPAELQRPLVNRVARRRVVDALDQVGDAVGDHDHLGLTHATRGDQRSPDPHPARIELRRLVIRD